MESVNRARTLPASRSRRALLCLLSCALPGALSCAPPARAGDAPLIRVEDPWARGTVEGQTGSGAYMRLTSREDAQLVGASSPLAEHVEIHEMHTVNDMMTMRRVERLALPAHATVALDHDFHVMLIGLKRQLVPGQSVPITLQVLDARGKTHAVHIEAPVRPLNTVNHPAARPATEAAPASAAPHHE
jgi:copper(I)-binding protein